MTENETTSRQSDVQLKPGWLERDVARASKRAKELRGEAMTPSTDQFEKIQENRTASDEATGQARHEREDEALALLAALAPALDHRDDGRPFARLVPLGKQIATGPTNLEIAAQALAAARADQTRKIVEGARLSAEKWQHSGTNTGRIIADGLLDFADILEQEHATATPPAPCDERDSAIALLIRLGIWDNTDEAEMEKDIGRVAQALVAARADERQLLVEEIRQSARGFTSEEWRNGFNTLADKLATATPPAQPSDRQSDAVDPPGQSR